MRLLVVLVVCVSTFVYLDAVSTSTPATTATTTDTTASTSTDSTTTSDAPTTSASSTTTGATTSASTVTASTTGVTTTSASTATATVITSTASATTTSANPGTATTSQDTAVVSDTTKQATAMNTNVTETTTGISGVLGTDTSTGNSNLVSDPATYTSDTTVSATTPALPIPTTPASAGPMLPVIGPFPPGQPGLPAVPGWPALPYPSYKQPSPNQVFGAGSGGGNMQNTNQNGAQKDPGLDMLMFMMFSNPEMMGGENPLMQMMMMQQMQQLFSGQNSVTPQQTEPIVNNNYRNTGGRFPMPAVPMMGANPAVAPFFGAPGINIPQPNMPTSSQTSANSPSFPGLPPLVNPAHPDPSIYGSLPPLTANPPAMGPAPSKQNVQPKFPGMDLMSLMMMMNPAFMGENPMMPFLMFNMMPGLTAW